MWLGEAAFLIFAFWATRLPGDAMWLSTSFGLGTLSVVGVEYLLPRFSRNGGRTRDGGGFATGTCALLYAVECGLENSVAGLLVLISSFC